MSNHINAKKEQISKTVFMAGDPLRVKFFVEKYLNDYEIVNTVRNETAYTGYYKNKRVTIFSHGMGMDSIGIYAYELFSEYEVENIIRFGSAGTYSKDIDLLDLVIADNAYTESNYGLAFGETKNTLPASKYLLEAANKIISNDFSNDKRIKHTTVHSSMWFYTKPGFIVPKEMDDKSIKAVEMEAYSLYSIAKYFNKNALTILTISDSLLTYEGICHTDRENKFELMFNFILKMIEELI